ncbi:MAG: hypothetical protein AAB617_02235 [Patescibacteria group bacterium]
MNKFSISEITVGVMGTLFVDGVSALLDTTLIGAAIMPVVQSFATWYIGRWVKSKGGTTTFLREVVKYASNLLPWIPTTFLTFVVVVIMQNRGVSEPTLSTAEATL